MSSATETPDMTDQTAVPPATTPGPAPADPASTGSGRRRVLWVVVALAIVAVIVIVLAPLASPDPDGLESIAGQQGWLESASSALFHIFPDYTIPGLEGSSSTIVAGLLGVGIVFLAMLGLGWLLRRRSAPDGPSR